MPKKSHEVIHEVIKSQTVLEGSFTFYCLVYAWLPQHVANITVYAYSNSYRIKFLGLQNSWLYSCHFSFKTVKSRYIILRGLEN